MNRARAKAKDRSHQLRAEIEARVCRQGSAQDAYADLRLYDAGTKVDVKVGNFKVPFSAIQLDSLWTLPLADRGLLDNVIVNRLQLAGREVGATIDIEGAGDLQPELRAGVFQGTDDAGNPLAVAASDRFGQNAMVRLSLRPAHGLELGASASARVGAKIELPLVVRRGYASELDVTLDVPAGPGQLRAWLEAMVGTSWIVGGTDPSHELTRFTEARGIAAWRFGRRERRARFFEIRLSRRSARPGPHVHRRSRPRAHRRHHLRRERRLVDPGRGRGVADWRPGAARDRGVRGRTLGHHQLPSPARGSFLTRRLV